MHPTKTDWLRKPDPKVLEIPLELPEPQKIGKLTVDHYVFKPRQRVEACFPALFWGGFAPDPPWNEVDVCGTKIYVEKGFTITRIHKNGTLWMSDAPQERYMMERAAREATGNVLVGGCGLGMYVQYCLHHNKVDHITVVELDEDIYNLGKASKWANDPRVTLVHAEISEFMETERLANRKYDTVYLDTHDKISDDYLPYLNTLRDMSRKLLTEKRNRGHGHVYIWAYNKILTTNRYDLVKTAEKLGPGFMQSSRWPEFAEQFPIEAQFLKELEVAMPEMDKPTRMYSRHLVRVRTAENLAKTFVLRIRSPKVIPLPQKKSGTIVMAA